MSMNTDELCNILACDATRCCRIRYGLGFLATVAGGFLFSLLIVFATVGLRADIHAAFANSGAFAFKVAFCVSLFGISAFLFARSLRPYEQSWRSLWPLALPFAALFAASLWQIATEGVTGETIMGYASWKCVRLTAAFAAVPLVLFILLARIWAPGNPQMAGAIAGFCAGSAGLSAYALYCTRDDPMFLAVWYTAALAVTTGAGYLAGRYLRW